ncbi:winged helix-turn-helix domain-containing protein [Methyloversatilis sp.]|uniref:winged helix-turn-helix domain-containing protein n=1 Tax=Methyloversatilis sp. TaxID=2569862 RepID=UPI00345A20E3
MRILVATDDLSLREHLVGALKQHWYSVEAINTASELIYSLTSFEWGGLLLGPTFAGTALCTHLASLRSRFTSLPIFALVQPGTRLSEAFNAGANDAVMSPPDLDEVLSRLRELDRRNSGSIASVLDTGSVAIDLGARCAIVGDCKIPLRRREFQILKHLIAHAGRAVAAEALCQCVYGWDEDLGSNALYVHIHNLRRKLPPDTIITVRGVGFMVKTR